MTVITSSTNTKISNKLQHDYDHIVPFQNDETIQQVSNTK